MAKLGKESASPVFQGWPVGLGKGSPSRDAAQPRALDHVGSLKQGEGALKNKQNGASPQTPTLGTLFRGGNCVVNVSWI